MFNTMTVKGLGAPGLQNSLLEIRAGPQPAAPGGWGGASPVPVPVTEALQALVEQGGLHALQRAGLARGRPLAVLPTGRCGHDHRVGVLARQQVLIDGGHTLQELCVQGGGARVRWGGHPGSPHQGPPPLCRSAQLPSESSMHGVWGAGALGLL